MPASPRARRRRRPLFTRSCARPTSSSACAREPCASRRTCTTPSATSTTCWPCSRCRSAVGCTREVLVQHPLARQKDIHPLPVTNRPQAPTKQDAIKTCNAPRDAVSVPCQKTLHDCPPYELRQKHHAGNGHGASLFWLRPKAALRPLCRIFDFACCLLLLLLPFAFSLSPLALVLPLDTAAAAVYQEQIHAR